METLIKWPQVLEQETNLQRTKLHQDSYYTHDADRLITINLAGLDCEMTKGESVKILHSELMKENNEHVNLCFKYKKLGLEYQAIIKTKFFNQIIRKIGILKDFYFFSQIDESGRTWADFKKLRNSTILQNFTQMKQRVESMPKDSEVFSIKMIKEIEELSLQINENLWPKHTDKIEGSYKRKIEISLPASPKEVQERIMLWWLSGFRPSVMVHKSALRIESFDEINFLTSAVQNKIEVFCEKDIPAYGLQKIYDYLENKFLNIFNDPMFYIQDGEWTVIIDQYGDFAQEKEILEAVKEHYNLLGQKYGIITNN